jgi:hypothetical protein
MPKKQTLRWRIHLATLAFVRAKNCHGWEFTAEYNRCKPLIASQIFGTEYAEANSMIKHLPNPEYELKMRIAREQLICDFALEHPLSVKQIAWNFNTSENDILSILNKHSDLTLYDFYKFLQNRRQQNDS